MQRPVGRLKGAKRPTNSVHGLGRGTEQLSGACFRGGGVDGGAWGQSQHEERRGVSGCLVQILARRRPVGRSKGAKRPTNSVYGLGRDTG